MTRCPSCHSIAVHVINSYQITAGRRRRFECWDCRHRWTLVFDQDDFTPRVYRPDGAMTEDQVREILLRRDLSDGALARKVRRSRNAIWKVRRGLMCRTVAPEVPRWTADALSCLNCSHWRGGLECAMDQPDLAVEGVRFAADCEFYSSIQSSNRD